MMLGIEEWLRIVVAFAIGSGLMWMYFGISFSKDPVPRPRKKRGRPANVLDLQRMRALRMDGMSKTRIAKEMGISYSQVRYYLDEKYRETERKRAREKNRKKREKDRQMRGESLKDSYTVKNDLEGSEKKKES